MKKIFTLISLALVAMSSSAQTEAWTVNNEDGTLKAEYTANEDITQMSVVSFSTTSVKGTHTSGPVAGYEDGALVDGKLNEKFDNSWGKISKKDLSNDGSVAPFYYVQGKGNPVNLEKIAFEEIMTDGVGTGNYRAKWDDAYYQADGSAGLPKNGTYVTLTPSVDGTLKVGAWINKGSRDIYVVKASDAKALVMGTEVNISGYINGQNNEVEDDSPLKGYPKFQEEIATKGTEGTDAFVVGAGNQASWVYLTFKATANETYYVFNKNTQLGFHGFEFTPGDATGISNITAGNKAKKSVRYNLAGQQVGASYKGIVIVNGKKMIQ